MKPKPIIKTTSSPLSSNSNKIDIFDTFKSAAASTHQMVSLGASARPKLELTAQ